MPTATSSSFSASISSSVAAEHVDVVRSDASAQATSVGRGRTRRSPRPARRPGARSVTRTVN